MIRLYCIHGKKRRVASRCSIRRNISIVKALYGSSKLDMAWHGYDRRPNAPQQQPHSILELHIQHATHSSTRNTYRGPGWSSTIILSIAIPWSLRKQYIFLDLLAPSLDSSNPYEPLLSYTKLKHFLKPTTVLPMTFKTYTGWWLNRPYEKYVSTCVNQLFVNNY